MLFRETYTDGTPMTQEDERLYKDLTILGVGGLACTVGLTVLVILLALGVI